MKLTWDTIKPDGWRTREILADDGTAKVIYTPLYSKQTQHRENGRAMINALFPEGHIDPPIEDD